VLGKQRHVGNYASEREAAVEYDKARVQLHGRKATLNFNIADYLDLLSTQTSSP
jgi:hypothetical protein